MWTSIWLKLGFAIWANTGSDLLGVSVPFFSWLKRPEMLVAVAKPKWRKWKLTFPLSTTILEAMAICVNLKTRIKNQESRLQMLNCYGQSVKRVWRKESFGDILWSKHRNLTLKLSRLNFGPRSWISRKGPNVRWKTFCL